MENNEIYVLCSLNHRTSHGWVAIAAFNHPPTFEDVMKLESFKEQSDFDKAIAKCIDDYQYCGIRFDDDYNHNFEYNVFTPRKNGDLLLWDYLHTGYMDCVDQTTIIDRRNF